MPTQALQGFGHRLKQERLRLNLTQKQIATKCDISRIQWGRYEKEENMPSKSIFQKLKEIGIDIGFVVSGKQMNKSNQTVQIQSLDELQLIRHYRKLNLIQKEAFFSTLTTVQPHIN